MKVIFLDWDGVIVIQKDRFLFPNAIRCKRIKKILDATDAVIVISSTWGKMYSLEELQKMLADNGIPPEKVIGITPCIYQKDEEKNKNGFFGRALEIKTWLLKHPEVTNIVVLDDDIYDLQPFNDFRLETDTYHGIAEKQVPLAIDILNKPFPTQLLEESSEK